LTLNPMTYAIDTLRGLVLTGWQFAPLAKTVAVLLIFDVFALILATLALRRGLR
jgi:ABC-type multidrug transport system permease subunit